MRHKSSVLLVEDDEDHTLLMRRALDRARLSLWHRPPRRPLVLAYGLGANSVVRKPVDFDALQRAFERIALYWLVVNQPPPAVEREVA